jgi:hypothetical protein
MTGPRDPSGAEAARYREAIVTRNAELLNTLVNVTYPDIVWGSVTQGMSEEDREWLMNNLRDPRASDDWGDHWSQAY